MKIINLSQGEPAWLAWRQQGVTASDAAVVLERSPYKTRWRLWAEKTGLVNEAKVDNNPWVRQGLQQEDHARQFFEKSRGDLLLPLCVQSRSHPIFRASLDGLNNQGEPVELKCPSPAVWQQVCEQQTESQSYQLYRIQVQHQLLVTGASRGWLVFHHQQEQQVFEITRDKALQAQLFETSSCFWQQVIARQSPEKDPHRDVFTPQGDEQSQAWQQAAAGYRQQEQRIVTLKQQLKQCEGERKAYLEQLKLLMGDYYQAEGCGLHITRYMVAGRVNYAQFIADKWGTVTADMLAPFRETSSERIRVTISPKESRIPETNGAALKNVNFLAS